MYPKAIAITEVGPREGFQFEGIGRPDAIGIDDKLRLIAALAGTGLRTIQAVSFVHPRLVPQMADAEAICARLPRRDGVAYTGIYLNDAGLRRALAAPGLLILPELLVSASEAFGLRNQKRGTADSLAEQRRLAATFAQHGYRVDRAMIMAAFGCNYEGEIPLARVLSLVGELDGLAREAGGRLEIVSLADTMGWANPEAVRRAVGAVRSRWPEMAVALHLHDTRGLALANVDAALREGVTLFDAAVGGLGGCPFAGHKGAAGNVATEEVAFLCRELGIETGIDLERLVACAALAEEVVGHPLPGRLTRSGVSAGQAQAA